MYSAASAHWLNELLFGNLAPSLRVMPIYILKFALYLSPWLVPVLENNLAPLAGVDSAFGRVGDASAADVVKRSIGIARRDILNSRRHRAHKCR